MRVSKQCDRCCGALAVLDVQLEDYDLICVRCGVREHVARSLTEAPPCWQ